MKKNYILLLLVTVSLLTSAQSFYKGALVVELNTGLEIFNTSLIYKIKDPKYTRDTTQNDKAGNTNFGFGAEFGLHKRFGLGFRFKANNYFTTRDSVTNIKPIVKTNDFAVILNYHPVLMPKFDLVLGADVGYSTFKYKTFDKDNTVLSGGGSYISLYVNPRIYFGRFGINFKLSAPFVNYNNLSTNNSDFNKYIAITKWKGSGFGLGFGIQYRFFNLTPKPLKATG